MLRTTFLIIFVAILASFYCLLVLYGKQYLEIFVYLFAFIPFVLVSWTLAYFVYDIVFQAKVNGKNKAVLVTGCSSGFGFELAKRLDKLGFTVFACVRNLECDGAKELRKACSNKLRICKVDVTSIEQVNDVVKFIQKSNLPLWALVNNAGSAVGMPVDWGDDVQQYRDVIEVNLYGVVRLTRCCLSLLRKSKGRIINVGSFAGRVTLPYMGAYCTSKYAQRSLTNSLRMELYNDNIQVIGIEPIYYRTPIMNFDHIRGKQLEYFKQTPKDIQRAYDAQRMNLSVNADQITNLFTRKNVIEVIDILVRAVTLRHPKLYYRCCGYFDIIVWFMSVLPELIGDIFPYYLGHTRFGIPTARFITKLIRKPTVQMVDINKIDL